MAERKCIDLEYTLEESTKALVDAMARGGIFPAQLLDSVSLLEQISQMEAELSRLREDISVTQEELTKYKAAYKKVKVDKDNLSHDKAELENRVYDLNSKAQKTATLLADLNKAKSKITELQAQVSTQKVGFESLYQVIKAIGGSRTTLFSSPVVKRIECRVSPVTQDGTGIYFSIIRKNSEQFSVENIQSK